MWIAIGFIASCIAGVIFLIVIYILDKKENDKMKAMIKETDDIIKRSNRFVLDGVYTEEEKGFK